MSFLELQRHFFLSSFHQSWKLYLTDFDQHKKLYSILTNTIQKLIDKHKEVPAEKKPMDAIDYFLVEMGHNIEETDVIDLEDRLRTLIIDIVAVSYFIFFSYLV